MTRRGLELALARIERLARDARDGRGDRARVLEEIASAAAVGLDPEGRSRTVARRGPAIVQRRVRLARARPRNLEALREALAGLRSGGAQVFSVESLVPMDRLVELLAIPVRASADMSDEAFGVINSAGQLVTPDGRRFERGDDDRWRLIGELDAAGLLPRGPPRVPAIEDPE